MARLLKTDGTETTIPPDQITLANLKALIGADTLGFHSLSRTETLVVNDDGLALRLPFNDAAAELYNAGGTSFPVVGDVVICADWELNQ